MIPTNLVFSNSSTVCSSNISWIDRETQTSDVNVLSSKPSVQIICEKINPNMCDEKPPPQCFQHVEVIKDPKNPENITIVKDTFSEEVIDSSSKRMIFCREVVSPILPDGDKSCPSEELQTECDPCLNSSSCLEDMKQNIETKNSKDCSQTATKCPNITNEHNCDKNKSSKTSNTSCKEKKECCFSKCSNRKTDDSDCKEKAIGIKQPKCPHEKPIYYVIDKQSSNTGSNKCNPKCGEQKKNDPSCEAASNIARSVQSLIGTVYKKTKEAAAFVASESCRRLNLEKKTDSGSSENVDQNKTEANKNKSKIEKCSFNQDGKEPEIHPVTETNSFQNTMKPPIEFVNNIASTIESTVSYISDINMDKVIGEHIESNMNRSSAHDNPPTNGPTQENMIDFNISANNLFETIKTKIMSMFGNSNTESGDDSASKRD